MLAVQRLNAVRLPITRSFRGQGQDCDQEHPFIVAIVTSARLSNDVLTFAFYSVSRSRRVDTRVVMHANLRCINILILNAKAVTKPK